MKIYAPKSLHGAQFRAMMDELQATPKTVAKFLQITERSVWRYLATESVPYPVLAALWHETPTGRYVTSLDVGNECRILATQCASLRDALAQSEAKLSRVIALANTGAANDAASAAQVPIASVL